MSRAALYLAPLLVACWGAAFAVTTQVRMQLPAAHAALGLAGAVILVLAAGIGLGWWLRGLSLHRHDTTEAGDTHAHMDFPPPAPRRRVMAGGPPPLPYSYDGRKKAKAAEPATHH